MSRARSVLLVLAGLTLAACGGVHPGDAVVVDGEAVSMTRLDELAEGYCALMLQSAAQQGQTSVPGADVRRQAVADLATGIVARRVAAEQDVTVDEVDYVLTPAEKAEIAEVFAGRDVDAVEQVIEENQRTFAIAAELGAAQTGAPLNEATREQLTETGQRQIVAAFERLDVEFSPRFGLDGAVQPVSATGSLSVDDVAATEQDPAQVPAAQRCS